MSEGYADELATVHLGDVREVLSQLPAESVHCVVTSPPYWGLRDYNAEGQLGLEATPEEYLANMVGVLREVRRVLRKDGTAWVNMGDGYASGVTGRNDSDRDTPGGRGGSFRGGERRALEIHSGLKPKDLIGMPWRLAFALQADGWWLRSDIIWSKPNPMPESVTDRPTKAHEYLFLLAKSANYYYDADAIREAYAPAAEAKLVSSRDSQRRWSAAGEGIVLGRATNPNGGLYEQVVNPAGRNKRTVWTIATQPYPEAHFATFPEKLVEPCILAGTSARGVCPQCGAPWVRETERVKVGTAKMPDGWDTNGGGHGSFHRNGREEGATVDLTEARTTGWRISCAHGLDPIPATVLDPFAGSGTTLAVAKSLDRRSIGIELNAEYLTLIRHRLEETAAQTSLLPLTEVAQ